MDHPRSGGLRASLRFVSQRILRTTPRFLAQVVVFFVFIYFLATFAPTSLFGNGYEKLLAWSGRLDPSITKSTEDVRVVVFGSQDVLGSAVSDPDSSRTSWTLQLCKELGCTSYRSLVPPGDAKPALTSNHLYETAVDEFLSSVEDADLLESPASDFEFLKTQYPVPTTPDLAAQVEAFLSLPPETKQSRSTIWVFTLGTWEVWNLASLPPATANDVLDGMAKHIFEQAELLYLKALNPRSIAFSNFWADVDPSHMKTLMAADAPKKIDERALETFRILVPKLFDMTLAPLWQTRPVPPYPHTRAEHMRNAIALTRRWNEQIEKHMAEWQKKARSKPDGVEDEHVLSTNDVPASDADVQGFVDALPEDMRPDTGAANVAFAPYPKRVGAHLATEDGMEVLMMNAEMRRSGAQDSAGNGAPTANASLLFTDVWKPCFASAIDRPAEEEESDVISCDAPDEYLFYDESTFNQRAVDYIVARTANDVLDSLFPPLHQRFFGAAYD
ncbi:hypothetical protein LEL_09101 [Akanthomyces lecanii RCEF 1005]|uniref:Esterase, SGNH hydrolase-type n=1 Tax=Akanthomyces lecanii RCEF 1005 TaxID=1081108 RepID=A0A168CW92_CORDF|nr:hypothetical protein LEL_09101 [Akanthomyces lecanii RCEF 1005]